MTSYSDYLKSSFEHLHKANNRFGSNATTTAKAENLNKHRKEKRSTLMYLKRNIDDNIELTPLKTDEENKIKKAEEKTKLDKVTLNRLQQLEKWKAERDLKKRLEKQKSKPIFKVTHVSESTLKDFESANKYIKGKLIAPANFKFKPPANLKPLPKVTEKQTVAKQKSTVTTAKQKTVESGAKHKNPTTAARQTQIKASTFGKLKTAETGMKTKNTSTSVKHKTQEINPQVVSRVTRSQTNTLASGVIPKKQVQLNKTPKKSTNKNTAAVKINKKEANDSGLRGRNDKKTKTESLVDLTADSPNEVLPENTNKPKSAVRFSVIDLTDSPDTEIARMPKVYAKTPVRLTRSTKSSVVEVSVKDTSDDSMDSLRLEESLEKETSSNDILSDTFEIVKSPVKRKPQEENDNFELTNNKTDLPAKTSRTAAINTPKNKLNISKSGDQDSFKKEEVAVSKTPKRSMSTTSRNKSTRTPSINIPKSKLNITECEEQDIFEIVNNKNGSAIKTSRTSSDGPKNKLISTKSDEQEGFITENAKEEAVQKTPKRITRSVSVSQATQKVKSKTPQSSKKIHSKTVETLKSQNDVQINNQVEEPLKKVQSAKSMTYAQVLRSTNKNKVTRRSSSRRSTKGRKSLKNVESDKENVSDDNKVLTPSLTRHENKKQVGQNTLNVDDSTEKSFSPHSKRINSASSTDSWVSTDYPIGNVQDSESSQSPQTPLRGEQNLPDERPVYISPFVTISRGKDSARKEYRSRQSQGGVMSTSLNCGKKNLEKNTSPKASAQYFTRILNTEIDRIQGMCAVWTKYKEEENPCENACDMINATIGHSNLLLTKKFNQFRGLIENCELNINHEKPVTCMDLHGFWEVIYMQVEDLDKRFNNLKLMKENDWEEIRGPEEKKVVKKKGRPKKIVKPVTGSSSLREAIRAKRQLKNKDNQLNVFDGGFFTVKSPQKPKVSLDRISGTNSRKSLLNVVLEQETNKRRSSAGFAMMKATYHAKISEGATPSKSILKTDGSKSAKKSVLFKDVIHSDDKTEEIKDEITESPLPKRSSNRLRLSRNKLF